MLTLVLVSLLTSSSIYGMKNDGDVTIYENQTIENTYFEFYQESTVIFSGNILHNVSISVSEATNVTITGNTFVNPADITITIWHSSNIKITENDFKEIPESSIQVFESNDVVIFQNSITLSKEGSSQFAIYEGIKIDRSSDVIIEANDIISPLGDGLVVFNSPRVSIIGNNIDLSGFMGLGITLSDNCLIQNNIITSSSNYGRLNSGDIPKSSAFGLSSSNNVVIISNLISKSDNNGLDVYDAKHLTIEGNTFSSHRVAGIFLGVVKNVSIIDNIFSDNPVGIELNDVSDITYSSNKFEDGFSITSYSEESPLSLPLSLILVIYSFKRKRYSG